jgi:hypothetical protein
LYGAVASETRTFGIVGFFSFGIVRTLGIWFGLTEDDTHAAPPARRVDAVLGLTAATAAAVLTNAIPTATDTYLYK